MARRRIEQALPDDRAGTHDRKVGRRRKPFGGDRAVIVLRGPGKDGVGVLRGDGQDDGIGHQVILQRALR